MDSDEVEEALRHWGRLMRQTIREQPPPARCYSAEHNWRSPQCWYPPEPRMPVDEKLAWRVEDIIRTWRSGESPWSEQRVLKATYIVWPTYVLREMGEPPYRWASYRMRASRVYGEAFHEALDQAAEWLRKAL